MSEDVSLAIDENNLQENLIKFDENFIIKLSNENIKIIDKNVKQKCKILQISPELDIDQKLATISALEPSEYPNLFIFIIEHPNVNILNENQGSKAQQLVEHLTKFGADRPLVIQQSCEVETQTKFYYKAENSSQTVDIDQSYLEDYELYEKMQNTLSDLDGREFQSFEDKLLKKLSNIKDSSIMLRFLRTLNLPEAIFGSVVLEVAKNGSKADLLAILDTLFENNGRILNDQSQNYIKCVFKANESDETELNSEKASDEDQDDPMDGTSTKNENSSPSILLTAVQNSNKDIIDYLIKYWTPLIQQLPVEHQIRVSTTALDKNQLYVLCDLLESSDFPFPDDFSTKANQVNHEGLQKIITDRIKFHEAIEQENYKEINDFIENNLSPKFIYSPQNITAMKKSVDSQKYKVYYYLKSFGLCASEFRNLGEVLDKKELKRANDQADVQKTESISDALHHASKSVLILCTKALIHNRKVKKEEVTKYREHIKKWFEDINKIAAIMLDVAASCENLVIIFDFESKFVNRTAFRDNASGLSFNTVSSRIFIGAELGDSVREQEIKGVLAHELCHYVMSLVYDNKFLPYYKHGTDIRVEFDEIVKSIDKWSTNDPNPPEDACNGIISSVFTAYPVNCFHHELIVRAVHISVMYDDNPRKSQHLQEKYQKLFHFWINQVLPELEKYLQNNKVVIRINATIGILSSLSESKIEFKEPNDMEQLTKNATTIVTTNVAQLLLIRILKHLQKKCGSLLESQNVFIEPKKIKNKQVWKDLMHLKARAVKLNIFVDCTKEKLDNLSSILNLNSFKFILVASNEKQSTTLRSMCAKKKIMPIIKDKNYNWSDLTEESQVKLLQTKITFQTNPKKSILDILSKNTNPDQNEVKEIIEDFSNIINDQVFNLIIEKQEISVNSNVDDSNNNNFEILFRNRNFLKKGVNFKNEISQEKLISITANNKHVLISDIAGSGKSWVVKNISKLIIKQDPTRWVTYVDLKQFIEEFKKEKPKDLEFDNYFVKNILKPKTEFEAEIFKKLYKIGKVSIIFDGYDEIAPDCAEFVADLAKLFKFNDGNQLWIVTRDYFEVSLQDKLEIDAAYKLEEFTLQESIDTIAVSWVLSDFKEKSEINHQFSRDELIKSEKYPNYQNKAEKMIKKILNVGNPSIGYPQFYKMVAKVFRKEKKIAITLTNIYRKFFEIQLLNWSQDRGNIRKKASIKSQSGGKNYREIHQHYAILNLFPEINPRRGKTWWIDEEIIAGGLLIKVGEFYYFSHETFREYFAADYIKMTMLDDRGLNEDFCIILFKSLTFIKFGIVRIFLNDIFAEPSILEFLEEDKIKQIADYISKNIEKFTNLTEIFEQNLENLVKFLVILFKSLTYEKIEIIFNLNRKIPQSIVKYPGQFKIFQEFLFCDAMDPKNLKTILYENSFILEVAYSQLNTDVIEEFLSNLSKKLNDEDLRMPLKAIDWNKRNIFTCITQSTHEFKERFQLFLKFLNKHLLKTEVMDLLKHKDSYGMNIFHIAIEFADQEKMEVLWTKVEEFFKDQNKSEDFRAFFGQKTIQHGSTVTNMAAHFPSDNIKYYESFWKFLLNTFEDREELKSLLNTKNNYSNGFLYLILVYNKDEAVEFTLNILEKSFSRKQFQEILKFKGKNEASSLQRATTEPNDAKTHEILCKYLHKTFTTEEYAEILSETDSDGLNLITSISNSEIFKFIVAEIEKYSSKDKIRLILTNLDNDRQTVMQAAATKKKFTEIYEILWKLIKKYFENSEILEIITHLSIKGKNLLQYVIERNTKEVVSLTWKEVKDVLNKNDCSVENINKCEKIIKLEVDEKDFLKLEWIKFESSNLFKDHIKLIIEGKMSAKHLVSFKSDKNIENHKILWNQLNENFKNRNNLTELMLEKRNSGQNYIHLLVSNNNADIIEFTLKKIRENLNDGQIDDILRSKGLNDRNLLQTAVVFTKELKTHQILWKFFQDYFKSTANFLKILLENDILSLAASFTTGEIFEFMIKEVEKITSRDEIRKILTSLNGFRRNLIQSANYQNMNFDFHEVIWKIIEKYFNDLEILEFIKKLDNYEDNLLVSAVVNLKNNKIIEFTWKKVKECLHAIDIKNNENLKKCDEIIQKSLKSEEVDTKILKLEWIKSENSSIFLSNEDFLREKISKIKNIDNIKPFIYDNNVKNHEILWEYLVDLFKTKGAEEKEFYPNKNNDNNNIFHLLVAHNQADVIRLTFKNIKKYLREQQFHEILTTKGNNDRNLLQIAINSTRDVKTVQVLWNIYHNLFKNIDEFLNFLKNVDQDGNDIFNISLTNSTNDVIEFLILEFKKISSKKEIKQIFSFSNKFNYNLLISAAIYNKSLKLHQLIWEIIENNFENCEILSLINQCDSSGDNILQNAVIWNTIEIVNFTWQKIKIFINEQSDQIEFLEKKGHNDGDLKELALENSLNDTSVWVDEIIKDYNLKLTEPVTCNFVSIS